MYDATFKFLRVLGVILLIGNVTATAFCKDLTERGSQLNPESLFELIISGQRR